MRWRGLFVALAVLVGAAGCTGSEAGTPRAESTSTTSDQTSDRPTDDESAPSRPAELDLAGVDPCELVTEQQLAELGIDQPPRPGEQSGGPLRGTPACSFSTSAGGTDSYGFLILASSTLGLAEYLDQIQEHPSRETVTVAGFPAVQEESAVSDPATGNGTCFVDTDVADNQMIHVQFGQVSAPEESRLPVETLCAKAVEVAEAVLTTLQGQR